MADIYDEQFEDAPLEDDEVLGNITESESAPETVTNEEPEVEALPEKYKGKSAADIARMHQELEKLMGRQAQEVGELRKLTDEVLKSQLAKNQPQEVEDQEIDFFADPEKFIERKVENHPSVKQAKQTSEEYRKQQTLQRLVGEFPNFQEVIADPEFTSWVLQSNVRKKLFAEANANFDFDSASELLSTWNQLKGAKQASNTRQLSDDMKQVTKQAKQAATVDSGGAGEVTKKIYRRADLIRLRMTDPARYEALSDEIMQAYSEGRVK